MKLRKKGSKQEMKALDNLGNPVQSSKSDLAETESPYNNTLARGRIVASSYERARMAYCGYTSGWNGRAVIASQLDCRPTYGLYFPAEAILLTILGDRNLILLIGYTNQFSTYLASVKCFTCVYIPN